ncbi:MAG: hypothetical protein U1F43_04580 [Myxococcota bacterium]
MITAFTVALATTGWLGPLPVDMVDFTAELDSLSRGPACDGRPQLDGPSKDALASHCEKLAPIVQKWKDGWYATSVPFFREVVPKDAPSKVVYPFGGADLLTALTIFPDASEVTIMALEPGGDPRSLGTMAGAPLAKNLRLVRQHFDFLARLAFSRTVDLDELSDALLAGVLIYDLSALAALGYEPFGLRYFTIAADGGLLYYSSKDLARIDAEAAKVKDPGRRAKLLADAFGDFEVRFRKRAAAGGAPGPEQVFRHISGDLEDPGMKKSGTLAHLELKGPVTAMTKASSYLLWWTSFSKIRGFLIDHMQWMISDSTGLAPDQIDQKVFEYIPYGKFDGMIISAPRGREKQMIELWKASPERPLAFAFGYPDVHKNHSLLITRRR